MNIWFSSDWHYGHKNIVKGESTWEDTHACRNFETLKEHDAALVESINSHAKPNDIIYFLGDFCFGGKDNIFEFRKKIKCNNIHLVLGNHDIHIRKNYSNCQSLFASCSDRIQRMIGKDYFILDHYAMRTWDNGHNGSIMLYGHSHGTLPEYKTTIKFSNEDHKISFETEKYFKTMDVGVDTHPNFGLYHIDEIREIMSSRISLIVDHHNEKTN